MATQSDTLGFAEPFDQPIQYLERIRSYYLALGYDNPYRWAHYVDVPFTPLQKPLSESRLGLVTTAAPYQPDKGDQGPGAPYNAAAKFYKVYTGATDSEPDLRISHIGIDRNHTTAEDINTYFPLAQLKKAAADGRIGELSPRFYGAPTNRSQVTTVEQDCADTLTCCREDQVDVVVIVAN